MNAVVSELIKYKKALGKRHFTQELSAEALERIEWYLENYFSGKAIHSIETGCGTTSVLFSNHSQSHSIYVEDDRASKNSNVALVMECPLLKGEKLNWFFGPTQETLHDSKPTFVANFILINGRHGYPIPEFEFLSLTKFLAPGGILVLNGIDIPTVKNLHDFISQERNFRTHGKSLTTAVFQKFAIPHSVPQNYEWWMQAYNAQSYPAITATSLNVGFVLPAKIEFGGNLNGLNSMLSRGFSFQNGVPLTEGYDSKFCVQLSAEISDKLCITLGFNPICVEQRIVSAGEAGLKLYVNGKETPIIRFKKSGLQEIKFEVEVHSCSKLDFEMWHFGLQLAHTLANFERVKGFDARLPSLFLHYISIVPVSDEQEAPNEVQRLDGSIVSFDYKKRRFFFFVHEEGDSVQSFHANGRFYEVEELEAICSHVATGGRILEVGAHMGNHSVFFSTFLKPAKLVLIEPNPSTREILRTNLTLNGVQNVDLSRVDFALSSARSTGKFRSADKFNTGGMAIETAVDGAVEIISGDELFQNEGFDFIKIDVEGLELQVMAGLKNLITRCQPVMFIEVKDENIEEIDKMISNLNYQVKWRRKMYTGLINLILEPRSTNSSPPAEVEIAKPALLKS
jgi:FkbM family methyltransferase